MFPLASRRSQPAQDGEDRFGPPTLERSGSEHRRAFFPLLPCGEKTEMRGGAFLKGKEGRVGFRKDTTISLWVIEVVISWSSFSRRSAKCETMVRIAPRQENTSRASYPYTPFGDYARALISQTDSGHHAFRSSRLPAPHSAQTYHTSH